MYLPVQPVLVLMMLSGAFYFVEPSGVIDQRPGDQPNPHRRHAVVAVGHGLLASQKVVLIRNSWGEAWGERGYAWLTEGYLEPRVFKVGILTEDVMYLPVPPQHSCPLAWLAAIKAVDAAPGHEAHNVIIGVEDPVLDTTRAHPIVATVDDFLRERDKSVFAVANTIFPSSLYEGHGAPDIFSVFHDKILPRVRKNQRWSGSYFERMTDYPTRSGEPFNPLWNIVQRIRKSERILQIISMSFLCTTPSATSTGHRMVGNV